MTTSLKVTAFEVARCGYFLPRKKIAEFGSLADCLSDFQTWSSGRNLEDTLTFKVDGEDVQETYCFEMQKAAKTGNYLITTWNKVPMVEGGVPTANGSAKVGKVDVALAKVANGNIPGYPSYFYFLPGSNAVFAMRPSWQPHNGHQGLIRMMKGFLETASPYVVIKPPQPNAEIEVLGFRNKGDTGAPRELLAHYESSLRKLAGRIDYLKKHQSLIRKIVIRNTLNTTVATEKSLMSSMLAKIGLMNHNSRSEMISFGYEMQFTPTLPELNKLIEKYADDAENKEHIGFKLSSNSSEVVWLNHSYAKDEIDFNVTSNDEGIISGKELLDDLEKNQLPRLKKLAQI